MTFAPQLIELRQLFRSQRQAPTLRSAANEPLVSACGIAQGLRLPPGVVGGGAPADTQQAELRAGTHAAIAAEDLFRRQLIRQRRVIPEAHDKADDGSAERKTGRPVPQQIADQPHDQKGRDPRRDRDEEPNERLEPRQNRDRQRRSDGRGEHEHGDGEQRHDGQPRIDVAGVGRVGALGDGPLGARRRGRARTAAARCRNQSRKGAQALDEVLERWRCGPLTAPPRRRRRLRPRRAAPAKMRSNRRPSRARVRGNDDRLRQRARPLLAGRGWRRASARIARGPAPRKALRRKAFRPRRDLPPRDAASRVGRAPSAPRTQRGGLANHALGARAVAGAMAFEADFQARPGGRGHFGKGHRIRIDLGFT